jgi:anti-anti-sigma factor
MNVAQLETEGQGRYRIHGDMSFDTVPDLWEQSERVFADPSEDELFIDLSDVGHFDSAGLALLVAWKRRAQRRTQSFTLTQVPSKLIELAKANHLVALFGLQSVPT